MENTAAVALLSNSSLIRKGYKLLVPMHAGKIEKNKEVGEEMHTRASKSMYPVIADHKETTMKLLHNNNKNHKKSVFLQQTAALSIVLCNSSLFGGVSNGLYFLPFRQAISCGDTQWTSS